jgi:hypothetical protein
LERYFPATPDDEYAFSPTNYVKVTRGTGTGKAEMEIGPKEPMEFDLWKEI